MNKLREIATAWATSFNPTVQQKLLAEERYNICRKCPSLGKKLKIEYCKECGCPIQKKIFTQRLNDTCPLNKWRSVEDTYRNKVRKSKKYKVL